MKLVSKLVMGVALTAAMSWAQPAAAQSTIFNIPTTDTVAPKKGYFEFDYLLQAPAPDAGQFQIFVPRIVVGVTPQLEVGVNVANTHYSNGGGTYSYIQPNAKYKFYADDGKGLAAAAGFIWYEPMNKRNASDNFGLVYGEVSKKFKSGARVTAGPYGVAGAEGDATKGGVILGYEQPLNAKVSFVADFFSGKNFFGYFTPGVSIVLPHNGLLNIGYSLGNDSYEDPSNNNRALFVYYGVTFP
jgi:hypothetical protein